MTSNDRMQTLLQQADQALPAPEARPLLGNTVRRRAARRERVGRSVAASAIIVAAGFAAISNRAPMPAPPAAVQATNVERLLNDANQALETARLVESRLSTPASGVPMRAVSMQSSRASTLVAAWSAIYAIEDVLPPETPDHIRRQRYQRVVDFFPETSAATHARTQLARLSVSA